MTTRHSEFRQSSSSHKSVELTRQQETRRAKVRWLVKFGGGRVVPPSRHIKKECLTHAFEDYLRMLAIRHIRCSPHHPQTNGKLERFHETLKARVNLLVYPSPEELSRAIEEFIEVYNHWRYHEGIGNVAPADVYYGRREGILQRREEQKRVTLEERFRYNRSRSREINLGRLSSRS